MARKPKKSLRYPQFREPIPWGAEFGLSYPEELEEGFERLRESLTFPQTEKGLTEVEFIIRAFEKDAATILKAEGYDPDINELLGEDDSQMGARLASAKAVVINAWRFRDALETNRINQAFIDLMLLTAAAIRSDLFEPALRGIWAKIATDKGTNAARRMQSKTVTERHKAIVELGRSLLSAGKPPHNISAIIAKRLGMSPRQVRTVLQRHGGLSKKRKHP